MTAPVREVELTNGGYAIVDDADYESVMAAGPWMKSRQRNVYYAQRTTKPRSSMHRFILGTGQYLSDHLDGDGLNNSRSNLRKSSPSENQRNRGGAQKNSKSGVRGVHPFGHKWAAQIRHNRKNIHLGIFADIEAAIRARQEAEVRLWSASDRHRQGAFARTVGR